jgi:hypothetical protein
MSPMNPAHGWAPVLNDWYDLPEYVGLPPSVREVYGQLNRLAHRRTRRATVSVLRLADRTDLSKRAVQTAIKTLVAMGDLRIEEESSGPGRPRTYWVNGPELGGSQARGAGGSSGVAAMPKGADPHAKGCTPATRKGADTPHPNLIRDSDSLSEQPPSEDEVAMVDSSTSWLSDEQREYYRRIEWLGDVLRIDRGVLGREWAKKPEYDPLPALTVALCSTMRPAAPKDTPSLPDGTGWPDLSQNTGEIRKPAGFVISAIRKGEDLTERAYAMEAAYEKFWQEESRKRKERELAIYGRLKRTPEQFLTPDEQKELARLERKFSN